MFALKLLTNRAGCSASHDSVSEHSKVTVDQLLALERVLVLVNQLVHSDQVFLSQFCDVVALLHLAPRLHLLLNFHKYVCLCWFLLKQFQLIRLFDLVYAGPVELEQDLLLLIEPFLGSRPMLNFTEERIRHTKPTIYLVFQILRNQWVLITILRGQWLILTLHLPFYVDLWLLPVLQFLHSPGIKKSTDILTHRNNLRFIILLTS